MRALLEWIEDFDDCHRDAVDIGLRLLLVALIGIAMVSFAIASGAFR